MQTNSFEELKAIMDKVEKLETCEYCFNFCTFRVILTLDILCMHTFAFSVYKHVDDLDLYVGGLLEKNDGDSILGPVFKCIIGRQFQLLKKGDRFFYDLSIASNKKVAFNLEELNEVRSDCQ